MNTNRNNGAVANQSPSQRGVCVVIGAGIAGLVTAYCLVKKGFSVEVVERNSECAMGASFANGGQFSFSHVAPFCINYNGRIPQFITSVMCAMMPTKITQVSYNGNEYRDPNGKSKFTNWNQNYNKCVKRQTAEDLLELYKLSIKSQKICQYIKESNFSELETLKEEIHPSGIIHIFQNEQQFQTALEVTSQLFPGKTFSPLSREELLYLEPSLTIGYNHKLFGIHFEQDKVCNAKPFSNKLKAILDRLGVKFRFSSTAQDIDFRNTPQGSRVAKSIHLHAKDGTHHHLATDFIVICNSGTSINSPEIQQDPEIQRLYPVRGYSLTFDVGMSNYAPSIGLIDMKDGIVYSRNGQFLRAAGLFDCNVNSEKLINKRAEYFKRRVLHAFPVLRRSEITYKWTNLRVYNSTPSPLIKKIKSLQNVFINSAHGARGVTLSMGSAVQIAQLVKRASRATDSIS